MWVRSRQYNGTSRTWSRISKTLYLPTAIERLTAMNQYRVSVDFLTTPNPWM